MAEATARELGRISLAEALELTALIALKEPARSDAILRAGRSLGRLTPSPAAKLRAVR